MTRYELFDDMVESPDGAWVRFEDVPQWQPIESGPRDGRAVLLHAPFAPQKWRVQTGYFASRGGNGGGQWLASGAMMGKPTHWMPLPPAPTPPRGETL